jgi:hypothetical protein
MFALAIDGMVAAGAAHVEAYPNKSGRLLTKGVGGNADIVSRLMAQRGYAQVSLSKWSSTIVPTGNY